MSEDFFGDLGKTIMRSTQKAASRTGSLIESTKIGAMITAETKEVEDRHKELGALFAKRILAGQMEADEAAAPIIKELKEHQEKLDEYKKELAQVRGQQICPACGQLIEKDVAFCPRCGANLLAGALEDAVEESNPAEMDSGSV